MNIFTVPSTKIIDRVLFNRENLNEGEFINIKLKSFLRLNDFITPRVLRCAIKSKTLYIM